MTVPPGVRGVEGRFGLAEADLVLGVVGAADGAEGADELVDGDNVLAGADPAVDGAAEGVVVEGVAHPTNTRQMSRTHALTAQVCSHFRRPVPDAGISVDRDGPDGSSGLLAGVLIPV